MKGIHIHVHVHQEDDRCALDQLTARLRDARERLAAAVAAATPPQKED